MRDSAGIRPDFAEGEPLRGARSDWTVSMASVPCQPAGRRRAPKNACFGSIVVRRPNDGSTRSGKRVTLLYQRAAGRQQWNRF